MRKSKIVLFLFCFLFFNKDLIASNFYLRRYDDSFNKNIKYKIEKKNKKEILYENVKIKKYSGVYKVGKPYTILGKTYYPKEQPNYKKVGVASWYGKDFHNKKTANGEIYNMNDYTAAHPTLPLPSIVRVTNLENGKSIKVRVNDRGPFAKNRIIDVSKKVAKELGFHEQGTTRVKVEYLKKESDLFLKEHGLIRK